MHNVTEFDVDVLVTYKALNGRNFNSRWAKPSVLNHLELKQFTCDYLPHLDTGEGCKQ